MFARLLRRPSPRSVPAAFRPWFERLEERTLLSATSVSPLLDLGTLSLYQGSYSSTQILLKWHSPDDAAVATQDVLASILPGSTSEALSPWLTDLQRVTLPDAIDVETALAILSSNPFVEYAQPDYRVSLMLTPSDPRYGEMWSLENTGQTGGTPDADIDAETAWEAHTGGGSTIVAVIDTGVAYNHPDLAANMWINMDEIAGDGIDNDGNGYVDDRHGYDFFNHDGDPRDDHGHGTHVAGTIGAVGDNGIGVTGINWDVQIMALKFLGADGSGDQSDAIEAILYAVENGAHVINASWGGDPFSQALFNAIATARDAGTIFVAAAGNGNFIGIGQNNDVVPFFPANYDLDNVVSVAATDHDDNLAFFSNYGATTVDLAAPGVDILSTTPGGYGLSTGTSMAAPHVSGVIALVRDLNPEWTHQQVINQVLSTVDPLPQLEGLTVTGGRLNAAAALPPERPEIRVLFGTADVTDGVSVVDIGRTLPEVPLEATFTVTNIGTEDVLLGSGIELPDGFTLVSGFGDTTLSFGESTTFTVRLESGVLGTYGGQVSFCNNDADEGPFDFTLTGVVSSSVTIDDGDSGFTTAGSAWGVSVNGGFEGDHRFNAAGSGADKAEWTFDVVPGAYHVAVSWLPGTNRATNAPFTVLDGTTVLTTLALNQELAPNDFTADGGTWESLGSFNVSGDTLTVRLSDAANEFVIADGVRLERIEPAPEIAVSLSGLDIADGSGMVDFGTVLAGATVLKTFTVRNLGTEDLCLSESISVPDGFSVVQPLGTTNLAPGASTTFTVQLDADTAGSYGGQVSFGNNDADEDPFNFAVSGTISGSAIIDNGDSGFVLAGSGWGVSVNGGFASDHHFNAAGSGGDTAEWTFNVAPGAYSIGASWLAGVNRATNAPFTVLDGSTVLATVNLNQEAAPNDFQADGAAWEHLGEFNIASGTLKVRLSDAANEFVIADAIRIEPVEAVPEIQVTLNDGDIADGTGSVNFGATLVGGEVVKTFTLRNVGTEDLILAETINVPAGFSIVQFPDTSLAPGESTTFSIQLDAETAGVWSGQVSFGNSDSDEDPFNFTVEGTVAASLIIDNGDAGFALGGSGWGVSVNGGYSGDHHYNAKGTGADTATWTFNVAPGTYSVAVNWLPGTNRATNAPYTVLDGTTVLATAPLNQEQSPNDFTADGAAWENLGQFTVTSGTLKVRLSDAANEFVIADAVRIAPVASASQIQAVVAGHGSDGGKLSPDAVRLDANDAGSRFVGPEHATPFIATSAGTHDGMDIGKPSLFERFFARRGAHRP